MSGLDAAKLADMQKRWARFISSSSERLIGNSYMTSEIIDDLKSMGLDLAADATYELLDAGLTRDAFLQKHAEPIVLRVIDDFNSAQRMGGATYLAELCFRRMLGLQQLLDHDLPEYEREVSAAGIAVPLNDVQSAQLALILDLKQRGALERQMKQAANECAVERFRVVYEAHVKLQDPAAKFESSMAERSLVAVQNALDYIDLAGDCYQPGLVASGYTNRGGLNNHMAHFERSVIEGYRTDFTLKMCRDLFESAIKFQADGHFALDFSGSGHGEMDLPMQRILDQLQENALDPRDGATFTRLGVGEADFWAAYALERQAVANDPKHSKLLKTEFKRQP